ncbi:MULTISPECIES: carbon-nitrogen hydrolase family protein [unclassified Curtobacterium]|uniref:carbon-nitrogen hydrolase family protein n=1 Tax=unclassified Curtobacterium TaxID=257496 RepID=UPI00104E57A4|nr:MULTISPECIES: carbon-nitrogen hydrolase family protein [unclassified Curtobacterium]TCL78454.1 N-carbamoylputrescine amidase [Curtobacterium sp. PhB128]TCL95215.1 N-carbamoylputrescine amidase [Curtobacterium sp. PhB138]
MSAAGSRPVIEVAVVQAGQTPADGDVALDELIALFEQAAEGADLVVFPELCTTPYFCGVVNDSRKAWAQPVPGPATARFAAAAKRLGTAVAFGLYEDAGDAQYNSAVLIDADGTLVHGTDVHGEQVASYRKTSIPTNAISDVDEKHYFAAGSGPVVFDALGTRFGMLICYDRSFPEYWLASRAAGAEVMLVLVSSMGFRETLFTQELQVRALETQTWIVAPNRGGEETVDGKTVSYFGRSSVVSPRGDLVVSAPAHQTGPIIRATVDVGEVAAARHDFPLGRDRQPGVFRYLADAHAPAAVPA